MVADARHLYVIGGFGNENISSGPTFSPSIYSFNLLERKWAKHSTSMMNSRCYVSTVELNDQVYSIGGFNGHERLQSVEKFDPTKQSWAHVAPMKKIRSDASAVTYGNKIIVLGGYTGEDILDSIEVYDSEKDEWAFGARMNVPRSGLKAAILGDKLFAIGGFDGTERLDSVETLDLLTPNATWTITSRLNTRRSNFGIAVVDKVKVCLIFEA